MDKTNRLRLLRLIDNDTAEAERIELLRHFPLAGLKAEDLVEARQVILAKSQLLQGYDNQACDLVGTGGDGKNTFNISTTATFIAAGAGVSFLKHGNRSITSKSGSFDCLEALEVPIPQTAAAVKTQFEHHKLAFLYAPLFHPALKNVATARQALAKEDIHTLFNVMGPLLNPAMVERVIIGVFSPRLIKPFIEALHSMGAEKAMVIHANGYDEFTTVGNNQYALLKNDSITYHSFTPDRYGFELADPETIAGGDAKRNAEILTGILKGEISGAARDTALLNAAAAVLIGNDAIISLEQALELAEQSLDSKRALNKLRALQPGGIEEEVVATEETEDVKEDN